MSLWFRVLWMTAACFFISINYSSARRTVKKFPGGGECWDEGWRIRCQGLPVIPNISDLQPTKLYLGDNNITSIDENDFLGLESLQILALWGNRIRSIESGSFKHLTSLRNLQLNLNNIISIHEDAFLGLESLGYLSLSNNRISSIERGSFKHLRSLRALQLGLNNITSIHEDAFLGLEFLEYLSLSYNTISSIERGSFKHLKSLQTLYLEGNNITSIHEDDFLGLKSLQLLYLQGNWIRSIERGSFKHLTKLRELYLEGNNITSIHEYDFLGLGFLEYLNLNHNRISSIERGSFKHLSSLQELKLFGNRITSLEAGFFTGLNNLTRLDLDQNEIASIEPRTFVELQSLVTLILDKNKITHIETESFLGLENLENLDVLSNKIKRIDPGALLFSSKLSVISSDDWRVCCITQKQQLNCSASSWYLPTLFSNPFSTCEDLMHNTVLRHTIWTLGVFAAAFNVGVFLWRSASRTKPAGSRSLQESRQIQKILSSSLALGDFFMGVFLLIIASADWHFRGYYILQDEEWRSSWICKLAGFSCVFSSELSVFTLTILSLERFWKLSSPGGANRVSARGIKILVGVSFGLAVVLAGIPLLPTEYFRDFYGNSSVCLPLPLTTTYSDADKMTHITNQQPGWEYSFFVFVGVNTLSMVIITFCYVRILRTVKQSTREARVSRDKTETLLLWRIILIVGTDMLCWLPVIFVSLANLVFWELSNTAYSWIAVFVLPINSALNPIIYTFYTPAFRRAVTKKWKRIKAIKLFHPNQN